MNIIALGTIFITAFIGMPIIRKIVLVGDIIDDAGGDPLKIHMQPVALLGGLVIVVTVIVGFAVCG